MKNFLLLMILCQIVFAHKINLFSTYEDGQLFVSSYFANGNGCKNCDIKIMDINKKLIQKAKTDENGEFFLKIDKQNLIIEIDAKEGHKAVKTLNFVDFKNEKEIYTQDDTEFQKLKEENIKLKVKIEILEDKLDYLNFAKIIFGLLIIGFIFFIIKRIKK